ncbi:chromodomain-helicase-DNA-binding protein 9 isoform X5 [Trichechus manatus latirostris]|uniref:Chromodomain-helicase-DNA-binding protein 9 isoform X5 n=1 Tax=Trichechus manatus latirostris TaxID=127582 RepID=A0A2Y9QTK8_TRIMA|nr:chromodomain-helicase-DNA-binding protein 9 isoform X5 [Trichechus manatus latirostris]
MTDPMMDFFDDANLFGETLEGLSDDAFVQPGPVSLVDELNLGAEFEPLHIDSLNHVQGTPTHQKMTDFEQLNQFDSLKFHQVNQSFGSPAEHVLSPHSQFNCSPIHPQNQSNGLFPDVADGSPMWGHHTATSISNLNGSPFHQQGHSHSMHQNKSFVAHHDFALFQANEQQTQCTSLRLQQNRNNLNPGQNSLSQSKNFMDVSVSGPHRVSVNHPPQITNASTSQQSLSMQQFSQTSNPSIHFLKCSNHQEGNFNGPSPNMTSCSVSNSQQFSSHYSFSSNHLSSNSLLQSSAVLASNHTNQTLSDFTGNNSFSPQRGIKQESTQHILNPNTSLNSNNFQMLHSSHPQGNYSSSKLSPVHMNFPDPVDSGTQMGHFNDRVETNGFSSLEENLLHQVESQTEPFTGLDPEDLLQEGLLPQYDESTFGQDSSSHVLDHHLDQQFTSHLVTRPSDMAQAQLQSHAQSWHSSLSNHQHLHDRNHLCLQRQPPSSKKSDGSGTYTKLQNTQVRVMSEKKQRKKMESESKQEKANRIISEAIAKAKERGERNIPRVMSPENFPSASVEGKEEKKGRRIKSKPKDKESKKTKACSKLKEKTKIGKLIITLGKKQKRKNESSDEISDTEQMPQHALKDEDSQKRRSNRQIKRKKYVEEAEGKQCEEAVKGSMKIKKNSAPLPGEQPLQLFVENPSEEDAAIVDKILSSRIVKKEISPGVMIDTEEFFVKYKNYSYLHCEWATEEQLLKDKRIQQKIKRFKLRQAQRAHFFSDMEEEPFNPDYVEVDRVLEVSFCEDKDTGEPVIYYLVKWCSLPYEDSTWELKEDVDLAKIEEFEQLQASRPDTRRLDRPPSNIWKKIDQSRDYKNGNQLREYQLEGLNWLLFNWYNRRNCILADEMGLGKTIQSITFLYEILLTGIRGPFLIIAPLSTIANWEREFRTWTDINVVVYHGSLISRQMIQQYEMYFRDSQGRIIRGAYRFQAIITTFEMILGGCGELNAIEWRCVIIDEAHRLKNKNCKLLEGLKLMNLEHKVLLTGTPLQNTVEELFSLLHFLEPLRFPSESTFMQEFGDLKTEEQVQKLQAILKPMMLRRLKEDVEKKLAPKEETIIEVELTNIQKKYYRAILEKNFSFLSKGAGQTNVPNLVNTMMELRKCCNHPYLIKGAEEKILGEFRDTYNPAASDFHLQAMIQSAGKLVLIDKLLPKMKAGGHKVLIFSQMVRCLDILEDYLIHKRYLYERIDGRVRGNLRQAAIDRFSKPDSDRFVFLLCTRAGGLGINLTAADTCIIFDSDWNPQNDLQAQARCHRIGQNKAVKVYRLVTRNSYEREMFDRASLKLGLDKAVLQSMSGRESSVGGIQQLSKKEIEDLLRRGAYGAIMEEEDEGSKFCEEDIDQILQRRTKTITIESEGRGSTFAKASFVASGNRTDISLDDPNFWQKWAKKAEIDIDAISGRNSLVIDTPRIRKQTRPFSATKDELAELSEAESEGDEKPKLRRPCDRSNGYGRTECFRVEKNLLVYGWGRWREILSHGRFKRQLNEHDVEIICRALLAYCLVHYRGDEKIKGFIWDLITPTEDGQTRELQNHLGLSAPVPRGRKGKKVKTQTSSFDIQKAEWLRKYNPEQLLQDEGYKKHIKHHCNKVLLRVRMLYYLKQEVIGNECQKVFDGVDASDIDVWVPEPDHSEVPAEWWDFDADKSLLIGVFKHGYEKYNTIRADPALCFLERVGKPDEKAVAAEQRANDYMDGDVEDPEYKPAPAIFKDDIEDDVSSPGDLVIADGDGQLMEGDKVYWPTQSALTTRLRRLITAYQRTNKNRQIQQMPPVFPVPASVMQPLYEEATLNPKMAAKIERQQRWTRREEADFYRVVSTFGVVFDPDRGQFDWTKFRAMARLHKKTDDSLEKYLYAFMSMCRRVCRLPSKEEFVDTNIFIQPITEERASRTLYRIELLRKVREQALRHPQLFERLKLCHPNPDLPIWWECGPHDRDLLIGAAKHGVSRTDYHILRDPELSFMAAQRNYSQKGTPHMKAYDEESVASLSTTQDETQDSFQMNNGTPESAYILQGGYMLAASYWPKDRVMINRLDSICQTVLKGKWPSARRSCDTNTVASFYTTKLLDSPGAATEYSEPSAPTPPGAGVKEEHDQSPQMLKVKKHVREKEFTVKIKDEGGLKLTFQKQGLAQKRPFDSEDGALGQQQYLTRLRELQSASETSLINFPKCTPVSGTSIQSTLGANGVILDNQPIVKKRRGRRRNVEGVDILFFNRNKPPNHVTIGITTSQISAGINPALSYTQPQGIPDMESPVPVINLKDGTRLAGDDAPKRKDLEKWLKEHPGYVEDLGAFIPRMQLHEGRPKQKRHRCRNPNKLDVNSLTGEERVQLINRRNARKVGGAFAPPLKDLCRFLKENSEYGVAPEWGEVVKQSGFLPESMYERILTGPVVREEVSRRGRRPKSGISKAAAAAAAAAANATSVSGSPLLANGLLPGVDLTTLQALQQNLQNLQSLQVTAGLMGMPASLSSGGEAKNMAAMFPMLLSGMAGLPNLLGMGGLLTKPTESGTEEKKGNDSKELEGKKERTESQNSENGGENSVSGSPSTSSSAALNTAAAANPLALNPLLLSNILYPGMLLTPGLNLHIPTLSQSNTFDVQKNKNSDLGSSKSVEVKEEDSRVRDQEDKGGTEPSPVNENSTDEGSEKADASSGSDSTSSSSEDSDSSNED